MAVKSRGNDAPKTSAEQADFGRMANLGESVTISRGVVQVKEPTLEQIFAVASDLVPLFQQGFDFGDKSSLFRLLAKPEAHQAVIKVMAVLTKQEIAFYTEMPFSDWLALGAVFKRVVDWEKMRELFSQLGLETLLTQNVQ